MMNVKQQSRPEPRACYKPTESCLLATFRIQFQKAYVNWIRTRKYKSLITAYPKNQSFNKQFIFVKFTNSMNHIISLYMSKTTQQKNWTHTLKLKTFLCCQSTYDN